MPTGRVDESGLNSASDASTGSVALVDPIRFPAIEPDSSPVEGYRTLDRQLEWPTPGAGADALAVLDDPRLVLSDGYVGVDRRRTGLRALVGRATHAHRRILLRLDILIALALATMLVGAFLVLTIPIRPTPVAATGTATGVASDLVRSRPHGPTTASVAPQVEPSAAVPSAGVPPGGASGASSVSTSVPAPVAAAPTAPVAATSSAAPASLDTPEAMGAAALAMISYPWQKIPGYSIVFRSIAEAPSPGFYGNTVSTWGQAGGTSSIYVYPGETVERLAAITAFEIGHEVDAAYVQPQGGHDQIANMLGVHPASWAPLCDCAEQGYLSGWYSAAFSNRWSPGVGGWSSLAPAPSGALLDAMEPWLDPRTI